ncbi:MAG: CaiB/BaiF CoA transferase family protein [Acidimicrobiales bacterium]
MLSHYRVLDLTDERGHFAGYLLAALGAEVIAIEPPGGMSARRLGPFIADRPGPERSLTHLAYNRNKRSIVLDPTDATQRDQLLDLVAGADVLIESADHGVMAGLGLDPETLAGRNPALVYTSVSAFGRTGPKAAWPATDLTVLASSCSLVLNGDADRAPVRVMVPQAFAMGSAVAACATLIALSERDRSGQGQHIDVAAQTAAMLANQTSVLSAGIGASTITRTAGGARTGSVDLQLVYPAADGHVSITHVFGPAIGPRTADLMAWACEEGHCDEWLRDRDWVNFANLVDEGSETVDTWLAAKAAVTALTRSHTKAELFTEGRRRRLLLAPIAGIDEVVASDQLAHRAFFDKLEVQAGGADVPATVLVPGAFAKFSARPLAPSGPAPGLGEHQQVILAQPPRQPAVQPRTAVTPGRGVSTAASRDESTKIRPNPGADSGDFSGSGGAAGTPDPPGPPGARTGALAGLKVLDFTWSIAGPHGVRILADCGATVVKVESTTKPDAARGYRPTHGDRPGSENSALFDTMAASKLSLQLDLNHPDAREVVLDLVRWADVVIESFSPRAMRGWNLDYQHLREVKPDLVMVSTCLTGQDGPLSTFAGYGNLAAALSGFYGLAGWPDRAPAGAFGAYTDYTSTHLVLLSVLAALDHKRRTGEGQYVDVAQAEAALHYLSPAILDYTVNGRVAARDGNRDRELAPHGVYPCSGEDRWVAIACQTDQTWPTLCTLIARPDLAAEAELSTAAGRHAHHDRIDEALTAWTAAHSAESAESALIEAGVAAHAVNNSAECLADPQLAARDHFLWLDHPDRPCLVENTRFRMSRTPPQVGLPPRSGQHTDQILTGILGYSQEQIATLRTANALR